MSFVGLERKIADVLTDNKIRKKKVLLCISGGIDSMVLFDLFNKVNSVFRNEIEIFHMHHGCYSDVEMNIYREKSENLVRKRALEFNFVFYCKKWEGKELKSEQEFRNARYDSLNSIVEVHNIDIVVLAHHKDDLIETRLMKMIRGTGPDSLVGMQISKGKIFRPLLNIKREEIESYAQIKEIEYIEDPSNKNTDYLRNWIRKEWLAGLESRCPGAIDNIHQSFEKILEKINLVHEKFDYSNGISRATFIEFETPRKSGWIAGYFRFLEAKNYTSNHIFEVEKRLRSSRNRDKFEVGGIVWTVDTERICAGVLGLSEDLSK